MSSSLNKVLLMGNLTRDPELRRTQGGQSVCELGIAMNRTARSRDGQEREETCFVDVVVWGKPGEACQKYLSRGRSVFIEGRLTLDQWESDNGEKKSRLRVIAEHVNFIGGGKNPGTRSDGVPDDFAPEAER